MSTRRVVRILACVALVAAVVAVAEHRPATAAPSGTGGFVGLQPARLLDTRGGATVDGVGVGGGAVGAGRTLSLSVTGRGGVPSSGVGAVVVNVTVTQPSVGGFVSVWPAGQVRPNASSVNFVAGETVANLAVVQVGAGGQISFFNAAGSSHLVVDVVGWMPGSSLAASTSIAAVPLTFETVATVTAPTDLASRAGSPLLYVTERGGTVRSVDPRDGSVSEPLVDISDDLSLDGEHGLLGLAFSPDGARLYLSFTPADGTSRLDELTMDGDAIAAGSRRTVIDVAQPPANNHKGGHLAFGPDGDLWWGLGDGGGEGDPFGNGQSTQSLLGGILRIDPQGRANGGYSVPGDNPWVNGGGAAEKWLYGLRNPWRFSFDRATGDLWIADVGQDAWEEVDLLASPTHGRGADLGWPLREGTHPYAGDAPAGAVDPVYEYPHGDNDENGCAVTGGYVYRGSAIPELQGTYFFTDFCVSSLRGMRVEPTGLDVADFGAHIPGDGIVTFGEGPDGEIFAASITSGVIGRIVRG